MATGTPPAGRVVVAGSLNLDVVVRVERLPLGGETVLAAERVDGPGGKGLNQAVAAALAGADVSFVGSVGDDRAGDLLLATLARAGVDTGRVRIELGTPSGVALVSVDPAGANAIVVVPGANALVRAEDTTAVALGEQDVLVAQGEIPVEATHAFLAAGRASGARTILNLAPFHEPSPELLAATSILVVNEHELLDLVGAVVSPPGGRLDGSAVVGFAHRMVDRGAEAVVLTLGAAGMVAVTAGGVLAEPARRVRVVDTTGAGDAVVGVLAAELAAGRELAGAMKAATAAASLVVQRVGASTAMAGRADIDAVLQGGDHGPPAVPQPEWADPQS